MNASPQGGASFTDAAVRGSAWTTLQSVANKLTSAASTIALGYLLTAEDFGVAWFAISAGQFALVLPVVALIDVLVASPGEFASMARPTSRLAWRAGFVQAIAIAAIGLVLSGLYPDRRGLALVMALVALRPVSDAAYATWLAGMRVRLQYRSLAMIDGISAIVSSVLAITLAALGFGPVAIVLPPTLANFARGILCRRRVGEIAEGKADPAAVERTLFRRFRVAAHAAYVGGALLMVELVALGALAPTRAVGLYAFAAGLASQINSVVALQAAGAMQPIVGHLAGSPERQVLGTLRTVRMIACLLVATFVILSLSQVAFATYWPSVFALKAQGRFRACLNAQLVNLAVAACVLALAAWAGSGNAIEWLERIGLSPTPDARPAFMVALGSMALCIVFSPAMLWLACRPLRIGWLLVLDAMFRPLLVAVPLAWVAHAVAAQVEHAIASRTAAVLLLLALAAATAAAGAIGAIALGASTRSDARTAIAVLRERRAFRG
jgi:O-antigen/teichoic acid export membrane protein